MTTIPMTNTEEHNPTTNTSPTSRRYTVSHRMRYVYSAPVTLDDLVVRLQPRTSYEQHLIKFDMTCYPQPTRHTHCLDLHGNIRHWFWFDVSHDSLEITTHATVDCLCDNPFDYIVVDEGVLRLPATYAQPVGAATEHYRHRTKPHPEVNKIARQIMRDCDGQTPSFLATLASYIHANIRYIVRNEGEPYTPTQTLERGEGACRDSAVLFIDACRSVGLAARFVSGYAWDAIDPSHRELHAWAEVYLPGAGWRGYDPTTGLAVADRHIAVAASPTASYCAPITGTFTGPRVRSTLSYKIDMQMQELPATEQEPGTTFIWP